MNKFFDGAKEDKFMITLKLPFPLENGPSSEIRKVEQKALVLVLAFIENLGWRDNVSEIYLYLLYVKFFFNELILEALNFVDGFQQF